MSFEKTVIRHLAESFPDLAGHLMNIHENMHDLMIPFQKQYYYSAAMQAPIPSNTSSLPCGR